MLDEANNVTPVQHQLLSEAFNPNRPALSSCTLLVQSSALLGHNINDNINMMTKPKEIFVLASVSLSRGNKLFAPRFVLTTSASSIGSLLFDAAGIDSFDYVVCSPLAANKHHGGSDSTIEEEIITESNYSLSNLAVIRYAEQNSLHSSSFMLLLSDLEQVLKSNSHSIFVNTAPAVPFASSNQPCVVFMCFSFALLQKTKCCTRIGCYRFILPPNSGKAPKQQTSNKRSCQVCKDGWPVDMNQLRKIDVSFLKEEPMNVIEEKSKNKQSSSLLLSFFPNYSASKHAAAFNELMLLAFSGSSVAAVLGSVCFENNNSNASNDSTNTNSDELFETWLFEPNKEKHEENVYCLFANGRQAQVATTNCFARLMAAWAKLPTDTQNLLLSAADEQKASMNVLGFEQSGFPVSASSFFEEVKKHPVVGRMLPMFGLPLSDAQFIVNMKSHFWKLEIKRASNSAPGLLPVKPVSNSAASICLCGDCFACSMEEAAFEKHLTSLSPSNNKLSAPYAVKSYKKSTTVITPMLPSNGLSKPVKQQPSKNRSLNTAMRKVAESGFKSVPKLLLAEKASSVRVIHAVQRYLLTTDYSLAPQPKKPTPKPKPTSKPPSKSAPVSAPSTPSGLSALSISSSSFPEIENPARKTARVRKQHGESLFEEQKQVGVFHFDENPYKRQKTDGLSYYQAPIQTQMISTSFDVYHQQPQQQQQQTLLQPQQVLMQQPQVYHNVGTHQSRLFEMDEQQIRDEFAHQYPYMDSLPSSACSSFSASSGSASSGYFTDDDDMELSGSSIMSIFVPPYSNQEQQQEIMTQRPQYNQHQVLQQQLQQQLQQLQLQQQQQQQLQQHHVQHHYHQFPSSSVSSSVDLGLGGYSFGGHHYHPAPFNTAAFHPHHDDPFNTSAFLV